MYDEKTKMLENSSRFLILEFSLNAVIPITILVFSIGHWNNLGFDLSIILTISFSSTLFFIPGLLSGICGLRYCSVKKIIALILCWIFGIIFLIENLVICTIMIINEVWFVLLLYLLILTLPNILFLIGCYKATKEYWLIHYSI